MLGVATTRRLTLGDTINIISMTRPKAYRLLTLYKGIAMAASTTATKATASAKKSAPKKTAISPAKKVAVKKVAVKKVSTAKSITVSGFERYKMIEVAAYYLAEKKSFTGSAADYWVTAEKDIDKKLSKK